MPPDERFLFELFASSVSPELRASGFETLLQMQFDARDRDYTVRFPGSKRHIVICDGVNVGRVVLRQGKADHRIVDIALLPQHRNRRIGTTLLLELIESAAEAGLPLRLNVERWNDAALRFFLRLGFKQSRQTETHVELEVLPPPGSLGGV